MINFISAKIKSAKDDGDALTVLKRALEEEGMCDIDLNINVNSDYLDDKTTFSVSFQRETEDEGECSITNVLFHGSGISLLEAVVNMVDNYRFKKLDNNKKEFKEFVENGDYYSLYKELKVIYEL